MSHYNIPDFGLHHDDYNWKLLQFLDQETLSRLPLHDFQIDALADYLDWDIMSSRKLSGWLFVKHKDRINWRAFIVNKQPKTLIHLDQVRDKLNENADLFLTPHNPYIKRMYYTPMFMSMFPNLVDWKWCSKNIQIDEFLLYKFWNRLNITTISKYQNMSEEFMRENSSRIKWQYVCKRPLREKFIDEMAHCVDWYAVAKYQKLSSDFMKKFMGRLDPYVVSRYQPLDMSFIEEYRPWLKMPVISQYQNMTVEYLKNNIQYLNRDNLLLNKNYNKKDTPQVIDNNGRLYIIETPDIKCRSDIMFCAVSTILDPVLNAQYIPLVN